MIGLQDILALQCAQFFAVHHQQRSTNDEHCADKHKQRNFFFDKYGAKCHGDHDGQTLDCKKDTDTAAFESKKIEGPGYGQDDAGGADRKPAGPAHVSNLTEDAGERCRARESTQQYRVGHRTSDIGIGVFDADLREYCRYADE